MGSNEVFGCLKEIFPQVDFRILRAVAFEYPADADAAVLAVMNEFPDLTAPSALPVSPTVVQRPDGLSVADEYKGKGKLLIHEQVNNESTHLPELEMAAGEGSNLNDYSSGFSLDVLTLVEKTHSLQNGTVTPDALMIHTGPEERVPDVQQCSSGMATPSLHENDGVHNVLPEQKDFDFPVHYDPNLVLLKMCHNVESDGVNSLVEAESSLAQPDSPLPQHALDAPQCSAPFHADENIQATGSSDLTASVCNVDLLKEIIEDAKNNKKTLFSAMQSVISMMREVEVQEKAVDTVEQEASRGGVDIMVKVDELKQMLAHAKDANDMHAGEVYGEKAILATEMRELQFRLLSLSDERDKSLAMLNEMRGTLEERLETAAEARKMVEQDKLEKEESARKALAKQELEMENVVLESKILQQQAQENSKLREFLMDRGRIVDMLQGEISVICQDVMLLKEKFDERVPLSQSLSSSQTSCILASSGSSARSMAFDLLPERVPSVDGLSSRVADNDGLSSKGSSRHEDDDLSSKGSMHEDERTRVEQKALMDDGWDVVLDF